MQPLNDFNKIIERMRNNNINDNGLNHDKKNNLNNNKNNRGNNNNSDDII